MSFAWQASVLWNVQTNLKCLREGTFPSTRLAKERKGFSKLFKSGQIHDTPTRAGGGVQKDSSREGAVNMNCQLILKAISSPQQFIIIIS